MKIQGAIGRPIRVEGKPVIGRPNRMWPLAIKTLVRFYFGGMNEFKI